ncbi:hypothetical protein KSS87_003723 [Heliosperma pusillum]|nr:hypothetical protein KSS87_003723 [Heliosperma pusillum]
MTMGSYEDDAYASSSVSLEYRNKQDVTESPQNKKAKIESKRKLDKKESKRKLKEWFKTKSTFTGLLDTTGASILQVDGRELKLSKPDLFTRLTDVLWSCRFKRCLAYFTHPGGEDSDGGMGASENIPGRISREDEQHYTNISRIAIEQYNKNMNNQQLAKLEFFSFIRVAYTIGFELYITFTACQNGQLGIYQAVVDDDWHDEGNIYLVLLRHLDADKIIAVMSLSGNYFLSLYLISASLLSNDFIIKHSYSCTLLITFLKGLKKSGRDCLAKIGNFVEDMTIGSNEDDAYASSSVSLEYRNKQDVTESPEKKKAKIESKRKLDKKESKRKLQEWFKTKSTFTGLLDTTGASILQVDGHKLRQSNPRLFTRLTDVLWSCRFKRCLAYFTHPGGENSDGGMGASENIPGRISREDEQHYTNISRIAIEQYNKNMNNQQLTKLEFFSFIRVAYTIGFELYITFTACQNGQLGIYQAVVDDDWHDEGNIYLVLLRHLDADKIIAVMSLSGAEEEWERLSGKNWKLCGSVVGQDA